MKSLTRSRTPGLRRHWRAACATLLGATALTAGLAVAPATAHASALQPRLPTSEYYVPWYDDVTQLCLESGYSGDVWTSTCTSSAGYYQYWAYYFTNYTETLQNLQTGRCLDGGDIASPFGPGTYTVYTSPCDGDDTYQNWSFGGEGPGYTIQNYQTGHCLDSNINEETYTYACDWDDYYQNWLPGL
jgi:hypothetical protein